MINVHASLLPRYRGAAPVHRAVIAGERETGVTIMRVVKALDAGPMLVDGDTADRPTRRRASMSNSDLAQIGARLLIEAVDRLAAGTAREEPQNDAEATYAHRLTKEDGLIDWARPARAAARPDPRSASLAARVHVSGRSTTDRAALAAWDRSRATDRHGTIVAARGDDLQVATGDGLLQIVELQAEGRKPMRAREFLAGHPLLAGRRLSAAP